MMPLKLFPGLQSQDPSVSSCPSVSSAPGMSSVIRMPSVDPITIRWMIRRDLPEVLAIETKSFEFAWSEQDFLQCLRHRNCIGMVAEQDGHVVGYMVYELERSQIRLLNLAVSPDCRRSHVAARMMDRLASRLSSQRRTWISLTVRETNLIAQIFFRSCGFRAVSVLRGYYEDTTEDAYLMQYQSEDQPELAAISLAAA